jgi:hypothetical protein
VLRLYRYTIFFHQFLIAQYGSVQPKILGRDAKFRVSTGLK